MEDMDSRWQRDCQRSPFESVKWQTCPAHQSVLERGNNQSHAEEQKKKLKKALHTSWQGHVRPFWTFMQPFPKALEGLILL